jgi:hypothetical protein
MTSESELHSLCVELVDNLSERVEQFEWGPPFLPGINRMEDKELLERAREVLESYEKAPELPPALAEAWKLHKENVVFPGEVPRPFSLEHAKASLHDTNNLIFAFSWGKLCRVPYFG